MERNIKALIIDVSKTTVVYSLSVEKIKFPVSHYGNVGKEQSLSFLGANFV